METPQIETEVRKRKFIFYYVTRDELNSLTERNIYGDICSLFASLALAVLLTGIITKKLNQNLPDDLKEFLGWLIPVSLIFLLLSIILAIIFKFHHRRKIKDIIGEKPTRLAMKDVIEENNPEYYVGDKRIIMNISNKQAIKFRGLFKSKEEFEKLKTNEHPNSHKTDYFTFIINNGNDQLFQNFQQFLNENGIDYRDYK